MECAMSINDLNEEISKLLSLFNIYIGKEG